MAHILFAWELGANSGHGVKIAALARALVAEGHSVDFALQKLDVARGFRDLAEAPGVRLRQAPIWPGLMARSGPVAAWGDLLAEAGMRDSGVLEYLLRGWDSLLADARPDLVVCEFAPAAQLAARGRVPVVAFGTGYTVPQPTGRGFRPFNGPAPLTDETLLCQLINHALNRLGWAELPHLGAVADADLHLPACFTELDPYAAERGAPPVAPFLNEPLPPPTEEADEGLLAYLPVGSLSAPPGTMPDILTATAIVGRWGRRERLYAPGLPPPWASALSAAGVRVSPVPLSLKHFARARLVLSLGGLGLTSACLALGVPQVILPVDAEKAFNAAAAARTGAARVLARDDPADALAEALVSAKTDPTFAARARALAPDFAARLARPPAEVARERLLTLIKS